MAGKFAAWPRRVLIASVVIAGCVALLVFSSAMVKAEQIVASYYGPGFEGATTANGETFDPSGYTAASKTYDFDTLLIVTFEGRSAVVRVNDRGPYVAGRDLDLSQGAAEYLGLDAVGVGTVNVEVAPAGTPTGPYGGTKKVRRPAQRPAQTAQPNEPARNTSQRPARTAQPEETTQNTPQRPATRDQADTNPQEKARQDFEGIGADQYASEDQYKASGDQYKDEVVVEEAVPPAPPAPKPAVPVLPPKPEPAQLESPPAELAVPNSTIERRVELAVAATPAPVAEPAAPNAPEPNPEPAPEQPVKAAAAEEVVEPVVEEKSEPEKSEAPGGITVLPDTGGTPFGALLGGTLLIGAGIAVRIVRR